ncbi:MAG TPA: hypothetical protein VKE94_01330 [Gemmataceae bacterium]|nr:hypothetical protein [Gemmataceae bacterium]
MAKKRRRTRQMPEAVARRILDRGALGEDAIVVVMRGGVPSRVFGLDEYLKMKELPKVVKPWEHRRVPASSPDPLGAVELGLLVSPLTREQMYEE